MATSKVKKCSRCLEEKDVSNFSPNGRKGRSLHSHCKKCRVQKQKVYYSSNKEDIAEYNKQYRESRKNELVAKRRLKLTGCTKEQFLSFLIKQDYRCAICKKDLLLLHTQKVCADHDHITNTPRGVLCSWCNTALGLFGDSTSVLSAAVDYLRAAEEEQA